MKKNKVKSLKSITWIYRAIEKLSIDELLVWRKHMTTLLRKIDERLGKERKRNSEIYVTDHAIVRYFERIEGKDRDELVEMILPADLWSEIYAKGNGRYEADDYRVEVVDNTVVTILPPRRLTKRR